MNQIFNNLNQKLNLKNNRNFILERRKGDF